MNSDTARQNILNRLQQGRVHAGIDPTNLPSVRRMPPGVVRSSEEKLTLLRSKMESVKTEFVASTKATFAADLRMLLEREQLSRVVYAPNGPLGAEITEHWNASQEDAAAPKLIPYDQPIAEMRTTLFEKVDAGISSTLGGIAETGSLIVWPTREEPRLLTLVPPVHVAVLDASMIYDSLPYAMEQMGWAKSMPTNALLISGPSKTADIEQTLCYGVHGPKRLIVMVLLNTVKSF